MAWQDVNLPERLALVGRVEPVNAKWVGFSLPNDPTNTNELMAGPKQRRGCLGTETSIKTAHTSSELDFRAMHKKNKTVQDAAGASTGQP